MPSEKIPQLDFPKAIEEGRFLGHHRLCHQVTYLPSSMALELCQMGACEQASTLP